MCLSTICDEVHISPITSGLNSYSWLVIQSGGTGSTGEACSSLYVCRTDPGSRWIHCCGCLLLSVCLLSHTQSSHRASPLPTQSKALLYVITQRTIVPRLGHLPSPPGVLEFGYVVSLVDTGVCTIVCSDGVSPSRCVTEWRWGCGYRLVCKCGLRCWVCLHLCD